MEFRLALKDSEDGIKLDPTFSESLERAFDTGIDRSFAQ